MWLRAEPSCSIYESAELQNLKHKLAHLSCKCSSCDKSRAPSVALVKPQNDKHVHVPRNGSFDQFTQVNPDTMSNDQHLFMNTVTKDVLCPSCFVTMNLLRGGMLRVLKDEESETKPEMFGCDKCSGKHVEAMEKATSFTSKPVIKFSNLTLCDFVSECSSDLSLNVREQGRTRNQVKFKEIGVKEKQEVPLDCACLCLENFIDSIRPPLNYTFK